MLTRRRFIGLVAVGGMGALAAGFRIFQSESSLVKALTLNNISNRHATQMESLLAAVLNLGQSTQDQATLKTCLLKADSLLAKFSTRTRLELMGALELLEQSPLWQIGSPQKFSSLTQADQVRVLKKWSTGIKPARPLAQGLKEFAVFVFYSLDSSWSEIGYGGPLIQAPQNATGAAPVNK